MDWKNDPDHYALTAGVEESPLAAVTRSLEALLSGTVPFELRTTVVEQLHSKQSFEQIRDYLLPLTGKTEKIPAFISRLSRPGYRSLCRVHGSG